MIGVGLYNILVLQSFGQFGQSYYITGGVLFVIVGVVKVLISLLGILGLVLGKRVVIAIVSQPHPCTILLCHSSVCCLDTFVWCMCIVCVCVCVSIALTQAAMLALCIVL